MTNKDRLEMFCEMGKNKGGIRYKGVSITVMDHNKTVELTSEKRAIINKMIRELKRGISTSKKVVDEYMISIIDKWGISSVSFARRHAKIDVIALNVTDWEKGNAIANIWYNSKPENQNEKFFDNHSLDWYVTIKEFKFDDNPKLVKPQLNG